MNGSSWVSEFQAIFTAWLYQVSVSCKNPRLYKVQSQDWCCPCKSHSLSLVCFITISLLSNMILPLQSWQQGFILHVSQFDTCRYLTDSPPKSCNASSIRYTLRRSPATYKESCIWPNLPFACFRLRVLGWASWALQYWLLWFYHWKLCWAWLQVTKISKS